MTARSDPEGMDIPKFTLAERDRRWAKVRTRMADAGIDAIFVPPHTGLFDTQQANTRYLTGLGGNHWTVATVFPLEGEVTALPSGDVHPQICLQRQDWVTDLRPVSGAWNFIQMAIDRIKEIRGLKRLGVSGLGGGTRFPEGTVAHGTILMLHEQLPGVELVNVTPMMNEIRFVKSAEEIALLRTGTALVERALEVAAEQAREGVPENVVYARMNAAIVEGGGETPIFLLWSAGSPQKPSNTYLPTRRPLRRGDFICTELQARYGGCDAAGAQCFSLGLPAPEYRDMFEVQQEAVAVCHDLLRPGESLGSIAAKLNDLSSDRYDVLTVMHGRGMGDDAPLAIFGVRDATMANWVMEENSCFVIKPMVWTKDRSKWVYWGDTVVCTRSGGERLGSRQPAIVQIG